MTKENRSSIEQQVMASVAVIYAVRQLLSFQAVVYYALILSLFGISQLVSVPHVLENFSSVARDGFPSILVFIESAVTGTTLLVQLGLLVAIFAVGSLFSSFIRSFSSRTLLA
ncbi:MAG: hypothetical protein G01um101456_722 [Parcubacteria group bacterium Gr01-1014_56]|nr:MAG: hypothetical protein G01um101456_722 [Parcubacteria group bacterium Gr01-1014_56]